MLGVPALHERYQVPVNLHISGSLLEAAARGVCTVGSTKRGSERRSPRAFNRAILKVKPF
jgi:hypothetical protein